MVDSEKVTPAAAGPIAGSTKPKPTAGLSVAGSSAKPKHIGAGFTSALGSIVTGVGAGAAALVAAPIVGAKTGGAKGFAQGLGFGLVGAIVLPVVGVASGVGSLAAGALATPEAMKASKEGKEWDPVTGKWILYDLEQEKAGMLGPLAEEALRVHAEDRRKARAERRGETGDEEEAAQRREKRASEVTDAALLYDALGVEPAATEGAIKKAYYKKALKCHPDKFPGDEAKKAEFQRLSRAYEVLSDPDARKRYDASGTLEAADASKPDSATLFAMIFGSEAFEEYVGDLKIASMMMHGDDEEDDAPDPDLDEFRQRQRCVRLAATLADEILAPFVRDEVDQAGFESSLKERASMLVATPFGSTLTKVIAKAYEAAAARALSTWSSGAYLSMRRTLHGASTKMDVARGGLETLSKSRAAARADSHAAAAQRLAQGEEEKKADFDTEKPQTVHTSSSPREESPYLIVSDNHSKWVTTFYASKAEAEADWKKLSYKFASVLFARQRLSSERKWTEWVAVKSYGTSTSVEAVKQMTLSTASVSTEAQSKAKQREMFGSVVETAWRVSILDIEATLKTATAKLWKDHAVPKETRLKRAKALKIVAAVFLRAARTSGHAMTWQEQIAQQIGGADPTGPPPPGEEEQEFVAPSDEPATPPPLPRRPLPVAPPVDGNLD